MSRTAHKLLSASGGEDAYEIEQSIMLDAGDDAHLEITPSSAGNQRTWTQSCWIKLTGAGDGYTGFYGFPGGSAASYYNGLFYYSGGNIVLLDNYAAGAYSGPYVTFNTNLNDRSAWYHLLLIFDTTQSTDTNRIQVWVNGVRCTNISATAWPALNFQGSCNSTALHTINQVQDTYYGAVMFAEYHHIDGTVKAYTDFTETDSTTGQLIPKKYEGGSYGTNGFYLKFVSGAIGTDSSGEGNNLTASNLANADVLLDTPTNNFSTLNSAQAFNTTTGVLSQGNLFFAAGAYSSGHYSNISSTFNVPSSGKWYVECRISIEAGGGNVTVFGVVDQDINWSGVANENLTGMDGFFTSLYGNYIKVVDSGTLGGGNTSATATSYILGMALDVDNGYAYFGVDSGSAMVWYQADGSTSGGDPTSGSTGTGGFARTFTTNDTITVSTSVSGSGGDGSQNHLNFGQNGTFSGQETAGGNTDGAGIGNFFRSPPSGFKALCTKNLPDPAIKLSTDHFNPVLYTGNDTTNNITGVGFQPDLVWLKNRTDAANHMLHDAVRGADNGIRSNENVAESDQSANFTGFASDGFSLAAGSNRYNDAGNSGSGENYVAWNWKANGSGSANTDGTINTTSTSVNTTAGFSIGTYTGEGGLKTVGHGLGVVPAMIMVKCRSDAIDWCVYFGDSTDSLTLNDAAARDDNDNRWNDTAPTSSVFTVYSSNEVNDSGKTYVYYAFAEIEGFSKFGQYTGNASTNGMMVNLGFRPAFVMIKRLDAAGMGWGIFDNKRSPSNEVDELLYANSNDAEADSDTLNFLSNGFKVITSGSDFINGSGGTMFYMAFAESPFKYANAR